MNPFRQQVTDGPYFCKIMFGLGTDVSRDNPANNYSEITRFDARQYRQTIHYRSNYNYMAAAVATTILCVVSAPLSETFSVVETKADRFVQICILPSFSHFWELGRESAMPFLFPDLNMLTSV